MKNTRSLIKIFFNLAHMLKKFDVIFLDPPYDEKNIAAIIENISDKKLLNIKV